MVKRHHPKIGVIGVRMRKLWPEQVFRKIPPIGHVTIVALWGPFGVPNDLKKISNFTGRFPTCQKYPHKISRSIGLSDFGGRRYGQRKAPKAKEKGKKKEKNKKKSGGFPLTRATWATCPTRVT